MMIVLLLMGSSKKKRKGVELGQHPLDANLHSGNLPFFKGVAQTKESDMWDFAWGIKERGGGRSPLGIEQDVTQNGLRDF